MSAKVGRNEPCPCGSGKKYKHCHLGASDDPGRKDLPPTTDEVAKHVVEGPPLPQWTRYVPWAIGGTGAVGTVGLLVTQGPQAALALAAGTGLVIGMWFLFTNPPPPRDDAGNPAGLDFGRRE